MSLLTPFPFFNAKSKIPKQVISPSWSDREKVKQEDVNLFCWERSLDLSIHKYLLEVLDSNPVPIRCSVSRTGLHQQLEKAKAKWGSISKMDNEVFWQDIFMLAYDFLDYSENGSGTMHLRVVEDNACAKFHTDGYALRLFTTYIGPGTEWLPEEAVNRKALGTTNKQIIKNESMVQQMKAGHVSILKGELPNRKQSVKGIVHRSPEIANTKKKRVILRVDI